MFMVSSTCTLGVLNSASPLAASSPCCPPSSLRIITIHAPNSVNNKVGGEGSGRGRGRGRKWTAVNQSGENESVTVTVASPASASAVVRNFYEGINAHDVDSVQYLIAENCVYEDLVFPRPFVGRKEIVEFFKKFTDSTSTDLRFVIDDLSTEDSSSVGVIRHLEWKGKPFPFSKGCSFYRLEVINGNRQITYGRDSVEPAIKPGDATLVHLFEEVQSTKSVQSCFPARFRVIGSQVAS